MPIIKRILNTVFLLLLFSFSVSAQTPALTIPAFNFYKPDKSLFSNKNLEPGKMLFFFFFDTDCEHCQHAMANFNEHYADYKQASVYLISANDKDKIAGFMGKYVPELKGKQNITLLLDTKNEFISKFQPRRYPSMFLYTPNKKLADDEDNPESMFQFSKYLNAPIK